MTVAGTIAEDEQRLPLGREFWLCASGRAFSKAGARIALIALFFLVIPLSPSSPPALALFYVARVLPTFLAGLLAGVLVDSVDRRRLMVGCDLGRLVLL